MTKPLDPHLDDTPLSLVRTAAHQQISWKLDRSLESEQEVITLDASQQHVVNHRRGAMLVLAGPGTGKTATLTQAVIARLNDDVAPLRADQVLVLTFARKAAAEIRDRIVSHLTTPGVPAVSTFHSLALSIVREFHPESLGEPKLLTGPEQELVVREILSGLVEDPQIRATVDWPKSLEDALQKRGLTVEIRNALARARALGISGDELQQAARKFGKPEWVAIGQLLVQYLETIEHTTALDYNELIFEAVRITQSGFAQDTLRKRYSAIFVDEYQDTDPLQVQLLHNLVGHDATLIAVGDPDQSIYGFRGADSRAVKNFATTFGYVGGVAAEIAVLDTTRRFGPVIRDAAYRVIERNSLTELPAEAARKHRDLNVDPTKTGTVDVTHHESPEVEAEEIAEKIRALVTNPNSTYTWSDVAILVRSGASSIATLERALVQAQIPVSVVFDEMPISQEPAVALLLQALEVSLKPGLLKNAVTSRNLLLSPLGGLEASDVRRIGRALRQHQRTTGEDVQWSDELIAQALANPASFTDFDATLLGDAWNKLVSLRKLLADAHDLIERGKSVHDVLWFIWSHTEWPARLQKRATAGGSGSARAHHDLDAVISLFELARASTNAPRTRRSIENFVIHVRGLLVPATQSERYVASNAVSLMTAHRSKGLQWKAVFICSADEGAWPDVKRRSSLFEPEKLTVENGVAQLGELPDRSEVVTEERRLFFVACTRAQEYLHVSTTSSDSDSGKVPSRFIKQLRPDLAMPHSLHQDSEGNDEPTVHEAATETETRYSLTSLISQLRRVVANPHETVDRRDAAAVRLAHLAQLKDASGALLAPAAHPQSWWGLAEVTHNDRPIDDPNQPVYVRGSSAQALFDCSLAWFMSQRAKVEKPSGYALAFGSVVHAIAEAVYRDPDAMTPARISAEIDKVWTQVPADSTWSSEKDRKDAIACIDAFMKWRANRERIQVGSEINFFGHWDVRGPNGEVETVTLRGQVDIVEIGDNNTVYIADIKTNAKAPTQEKTRKNLQLALYQVAAEKQLLEGLDTSAIQDGLPLKADGAELVLVRDTSPNNYPKKGVQHAVSIHDEEPHWIETTMFEAARIVREEKYVPTLGDGCQYCNIKNSCPLQPEGKPVIS